MTIVSAMPIPVLALPLSPVFCGVFKVRVDRVVAFIRLLGLEFVPPDKFLLLAGTLVRSSGNPGDAEHATTLLALS